MAPSTRATWLMLIAVAAFAGMDASLKLLAAYYPPLQVSALRGFASLPFVLAWALATGGWASLRPVRIGLHVLRGVLGIAMMVGFVYGIARLPLSTAYAITFIAPLLVTLLAVPFLGEHVGPRRLAAVAAGLVGVMVILRPGGGVLSAAGLAVVGAAVCYAVGAITVRMLTRTDSTQAMVVWMLFLLGAGAGLLALPGWVPMRASDLGIVAHKLKHVLDGCLIGLAVVANFKTKVAVFGAHLLGARDGIAEGDDMDDLPQGAEVLQKSHRIHAIAQHMRTKAQRDVPVAGGGAIGIQAGRCGL